MATYIWVNFGSGNSLLPDGTKPLPEPSWLLINEVLGHSHEINFTSAQATILYNEFEDYTFKIIATSSRGQWLNTFKSYHSNVNHNRVLHTVTSQESYGMSIVTILYNIDYDIIMGLHFIQFDT